MRVRRILESSGLDDDTVFCISGVNSIIFKAWTKERPLHEQCSGIDVLPFLEFILDCKTKYTAAITTFEKMYIPRILMRTWGSSKGIFFETCIIPRMIIRFVL